MDVRQFLSTLALTFDHSLAATRVEIYVEKLSPIPSHLWPRIEKEITRSCKRFPSIAEIFVAAQECSWRENDGSGRPHTWQVTDCRLCEGSGMCAVWYEHSFERRPTGTVELFDMKWIEPYQTSGRPIGNDKPEPVRYFFRCSCPAGEKPNGMTGLPRWDSERPHEHIERMAS